MVAWALRSMVRQAFGLVDAVLCRVWLETKRDGRDAKAAIRLSGRRKTE